MAHKDYYEVYVCPTCHRDDGLTQANDQYQHYGYSKYCFNCSRPCNHEVVVYKEGDLK